LDLRDQSQPDGWAADLMDKIRDGDPSALAPLYRRTSPLLFGIVLGILDNRLAAEQALLETYAEIWNRADACDPAAMHPLEWMARVARARAIAIASLSRKQRSGRQFPAAVREPTVAPELQKRARSAIASLSPAQREILEWAYYSGLSTAEIAAQTGKPLGAVRTHVRLGLGRLAGPDEAGGTP